MSADTRCPACGGLLALVHELREDGAALRERFASRRATTSGPDVSGVWRYRELVLPSVVSPVSGPEGNTPLISRAAVSTWAGADGLLLKHEGMNPTGSFKDRGMTVAVTQAVRLGATAVACASTGNTSSSLAAYAAQAGLPALVFIPQNAVALGKLSQSLAYGARTLLVRGDFDQCLALAQQASSELGVYLVNSINPFRIEGQKTIMLELLEQLGWQPPDWVVVPAGNLGNTAAFGKAFREAVAAGLLPRMPRLAAIQAEGAAPFARSFGVGFRERFTVKAETLATAIRIGNPASWDRAVRAIRETNGVVTSVSDEEILEAKAVVDGAGVGCEPASAASVAGVRALRRSGVIGAGELVVAILTGHVLKDPDASVGSANMPIEIDADLAEVERALADSGR
jgi:threonine synthase